MTPVDPDFLAMFDGDGTSNPTPEIGQPSRLALEERRLGQLAGLVLVVVGVMVGVGVSDRNPSLAALGGQPRVVQVDPFGPPESALSALAAPVAGPPIVETVYVNGPAAPKPNVIVRTLPPDPGPKPNRRPPSPQRPVPSKVKHVALVILPATDQRAQWPDRGTTEAPYMANELRSQGTLLESYRSVGRSDLSNRIALISGQQPNADTEAGCPVFKDFARPFKVDANGLVAGSGCYFPYDQNSAQTWTLPDSLSRKGLESKGYIGDADRAPGTGKPGVSGCRRPSIGGADTALVGTKDDGFVTRHDPLLYFSSLFETAACDSNVDSNIDRPLTGLARDVAADVQSKGNPSKLPTFSLIVPTACDGGLVDDCGSDPASGKPRPTGLAAVDSFLKREVKPLIESPSFRRDGLVIIAFDRATAPDGLTGGEPGSGPAGALLVGPFVKREAVSRVGYDHYSTLASIQDLLGLDRIARAKGGLRGKPTLNSFCSDVFGSDPFAKSAPCRLGPDASDS